MIIEIDGRGLKAVRGSGGEARGIAKGRGGGRGKVIVTVYHLDINFHGGERSIKGNLKRGLKLTGQMTKGEGINFGGS